MSDIPSDLARALYKVVHDNSIAQFAISEEQIQKLIDHLDSQCDVPAPYRLRAQQFSDMILQVTSNCMGNTFEEQVIDSYSRYNKSV